MSEDAGRANPGLLTKDPELEAFVIERGKGKGTIYTDRRRDILVSDMRWEANRWEHSREARLVYFCLCRSGGGYFSRHSEKQRITGQLLPGTVEICLPNQTGYSDAPSVHYTVIGITPERLDAAWQEMVPNAPLSALNTSRLYRVPLVEQLIVSTFERAEVDGLSSLFFDHVLGLLVYKLALAKPGPAAASKLSSRQLKIALDFINDRLAEDIRLPDLASTVGLSVAEFSRRFRESLGVPPYTYLQQQRMNKAVALMVNEPGLSVSEIGSQVGYVNLTIFSRSFQRFTGLPPSKWRKANA